MPVAQYPTNLEEIMSGRSVAAMDMALQQQQQARLADQLSAQEAQQKYQFAQDQHPLDLDKIQADINHSNASTGNLQSLTEGNTLKNRFDRDTYQSRINKALSDNDTEVAKNMVARSNAVAQHIHQLADYMDQGGQIPLDANIPDEIKTLAAQGTKAMRQYADHITFSDPAYQRDMKKLSTEEGFRSSERSKDRDLQRELTNLKYDSLFKIADQKLKGAAGSKNWQQASIQADVQAAALEAAGQTEQAANAKAWADYYRQLTMNLAGTSNASKLDLEAASKGDITRMPPPSVPQAPAGGAPGAAASAPMTLPGGIVVHVKKSGPQGSR